MERIVVEKPCSENWATMKNCGTGKFCNRCSKNLIDFTGKGTNEIVEILGNAKENKICGRFNTFQLNAGGGWYVRMLNAAHCVENRFLKTVLTTIISGVILLSGCATTVGEPAFIPTDTTTTSQDSTGIKGEFDVPKDATIK